MTRRPSPGHRSLSGASSWGLAAAIGLSVATTPGTARAECMGFNPWPAFDDAARSADRIVVGRVTDILRATGSYPTRFRVAVIEDVRGHNAPSQVVSGVRTLGGCASSWLLVETGDVIAIAYGPDERIAGPVSGVAFINREPPDEVRPMPGLTRVSLQHVRMFGSLPPTDTATVPPVVATGVLGTIGLALRAVMDRLADWLLGR